MKIFMTCIAIILVAILHFFFRASVRRGDMAKDEAETGIGLVTVIYVLILVLLELSL